MPTTQKPQQKQTKATQKVGGSAKKPVTKATEGGKGKIAAVKSKTTTRSGSVKGDSVKTYATKPRQHIRGVGGASKTVIKGQSIKKGGSNGKCYEVTTENCGDEVCYKVTRCNRDDIDTDRGRYGPVNQNPSVKSNPKAKTVVGNRDDIDTDMGRYGPVNQSPSVNSGFGDMGSQRGMYGDHRDVGHPHKKGIMSNLFNSGARNSTNNSNRPWDMGDQLGRR